jgi:hypothetical protein
MPLFKDGTGSGGPPAQLAVLDLSDDDVIDALHE